MTQKVIYSTFLNKVFLGNKQLSQNADNSRFQGGILEMEATRYVQQFYDSFDSETTIKDN